MEERILKFKNEGIGKSKSFTKIDKGYDSLVTEPIFFSINGH